MNFGEVNERGVRAQLGCKLGAEFFCELHLWMKLDFVMHFNAKAAETFSYDALAESMWVWTNTDFELSSACNIKR